MGKGYMGKVLNIDLSQGTIQEEQIPDEIYEKVLSGAGLAAKLLFDKIPQGADPLGPDNVLGFVSGLLTGTGSYFTGRWMVTGKSPLTNGYGEANCGGTFSPAIKRCGYDGIFISGISNSPVALCISDGKAELKDATHLWGKDAVEAESILMAEMGDKARVAVIGPAGENVSLISGVCNDRGRIAARSGLGAVMGAKRLKAIALQGKEKIPVENPDQIKELNKTFMKWFRNEIPFEKRIPSRLFSIMGKFLRISPVAMAQDSILVRMAFKNFGTIVTNVLSAENGDSPIKNWQGAGFRDFPVGTHSGKLDPQLIIDRQYKKYHCYSCPMGCGGLCRVTSEKYPLEETHKPEYETCCAFGALLLINDLEAIFKINDMLNRAGMDTISAGATVAFAMECYENGILSRDDLDGIDLVWGNVEGVIALLEKMIQRQGIGDLLADGVKKAAEKIGKGSEQFAIHAGGQELPMHDPRFDPGFSTAYELEPTPGRHTNVGCQWVEMFGLHKIFKDLPRSPPIYLLKEKYKIEGKEILQAAGSKYVQLANGLGACLFGLYFSDKFPLIDYTNATTGWCLSPEEYLLAGERIQNIRQAFNKREGINPARDFRMSARAAGDPPLTYGPLKGIQLDREQLNRNYCRAMSWDEETGTPKQEKLEELGLTDIAAALSK